MILIASITQIFAALMILLGLMTYFGTEGHSLTALIPAFLGTLIGILGYLISVKKYSYQPLYGALVMATLGFIGTADGFYKWYYESSSYAISKSVMAVLCAIYIAAILRYFRDAQKIT